METQVLADLTPFIPDVLKKVPWQVRTALIFAFLLFSGYAVLAQLAGWSLFPHASVYWGVLGLLAGAPAGANVTVKKGDTKAAIGDLEQLGNLFQRAMAAAPAPVVHVYADIESIADRIKKTAEQNGPLINTIGQDAVQVVDEVDPALEPAIAPIPAEVASAVADLTDPTPPASETPSAPSDAASPSPESAPPISPPVSDSPSPSETPLTPGEVVSPEPGSAPAIG